MLRHVPQIADPAGAKIEKGPIVKDSHWSTQKEKAAGYWLLAFTLFIFKLLPVIILRLLCFPVGFCYFIFSKKTREHSRLYLRRLSSAMGGGKKFSSLKHIIAFSLSLVEKIEAWSGKVSFTRIHFQDDDIQELVQRLEKGQGAFLISSHLGNMEFIRGLAGFNRTGVSREIPVNAIVDFTVTAHFNRMLSNLNPHSVTQIISARELGPQTVILLQEKIAAGELVVIAGDRTSANPGSRYLSFPFLGEEAPFPYGPFFLAALSEAPIYAVFAMRQKDLSLSSHYALHIHHSPVSFDCPRSQRENRIGELVNWYASLLEQYCKKYPHQWYNFYDFFKPAVEDEEEA
jgi:predicted LPLAT superfamily acyltransferase